MSRPPDKDRHRAEILEDVHVKWFAHLDGVPGLEVHCDPDITWKLSAGVRVRF